jgi:hypothetical protein
LIYVLSSRKSALIGSAWKIFLKFTKKKSRVKSGLEPPEKEWGIPAKPVKQCNLNKMGVAGFD